MSDTSMPLDLGELADAFIDPSDSGEIIQGVVSTKVTSNTYTVTLQGGAVAVPARSLVPLVPGDTVWMLRKNNFLLVLNHQDTGWHIVGAGGEPAFQNGWTSTVAAADPVGDRAAKFRKLGGIVYLDGRVETGTVNTAIFTLPAGFRPGAKVSFATNATNAFGSLSVTNDGVVFLEAGAVIHYLDVVRFVAER